MCGSSASLAGKTADSASAKTCPASAPMSNEEKNSPPRKPVPSEKPDRTRHHEITTSDARDVERSDSHRCRIEQIGDDVADQRSQSHGSEACDRIASDHDFERIECSPKWRSECTRDRARRSAPNQYAQISAPEVEGTPDPRPNAARQLRVAGLETDRGANSTRPHGLQRHADASNERHAPAVQGVGLDRIDLPRR